MIATPDQHLRVYVSSAPDELAAERAAARRAVEQLRQTPVLLELAARAHPPRALYRAYLEQSDVFVGVYGERHGPTQEDEYALSEGRPALIYVKQGDERDPRLTDLLHRIQADDRASYKRFTTPEELGELLADDLAILLTERFDAAPAPDTGAPAAPPRAALPAPPTPLVGRERELAELDALVARPDVRLVTLLGPGGIGKTRLALEVAGRALPRFRDGVRFVALGAVLEPGLVLSTVAAALGVRPEGPRPLVERLAAELDGQELLVVLDNFEQVLDAGAGVAALLGDAPGLTVLVTSRAALRLRGEHQYPVPPLATPPADPRATPAELLEAAAVRLFVARAQEVRYTFAPDADDARAIAELCRRLDGIPLAIELAAARLRLLTPQALLTRLGDRIDLLRTDLADVPVRQRTLRATLDWSHGLLDADTQRLFRGLGVFAGSISLAAAEAVCGDGADVLEGLAALVDQSLLVPEAGADEPRFHLLRIVREYARELLTAAGELEQRADRHLHHYAALAHEAGPGLRGLDQQDWLERLDRDLADLRAALRWGLARAPHASVAIAHGLRVFWWMRDHMAEAREYEDDLLALVDELDDADRARVLFMTGASAWIAGDHAVAEPRLARAVALGRELDDEYLVTGPLILLAPLAFERGDTATAEAWLAEGLQSARDRGDDPWGVAYVLLQYTQLGLRGGDIARATAMARELVDIARRLRNGPFMAQGLVLLGYLALLAGDLPGARALLAEAAGTYGGLRYREGLNYCLVGIAAVALAEGEARRAAVGLAAAAALRERVGIAPWPFLAPVIDDLERQAREALGPEEHARAEAEGRALTPAGMVALALAQDA